MIKHTFYLIFFYVFTLLFITPHIVYTNNIYSDPVNHSIYLTPIKKSVLYDSFTDTLNPFIYSFHPIMVTDDDLLKLEDEYAYENGLFGDILKVTVVEGYYKGKTGYILDEYVKLAPGRFNDPIYIFFKSDTYFEGNIIKENRQFRVIASSMDGPFETLRLINKDDDPEERGITYYNKNDLHYIINKKTELAYHARKKDIIIKIVDSQNLLPVHDAAYQNNICDDYGIMYIENTGKNHISHFPINIKKMGFSEGIIQQVKPNQHVFLSVLSKLNHIPYYDDRASLYEKDIFTFTIHANNFSVSGQQGIKVANIDTYDLFTYPNLPDDFSQISGGFYLAEKPDLLKIDCAIERDNNEEVYYFSEILNTWQKLSFDMHDNKAHIHDLQHGYYLVMKTVKDSPATIDLQETLFHSQVYMKDRDTQIFGLAEKNRSIPHGRYETIYFDIEYPDTIINQLEYVESNSLQIELDGSKYVGPDMEINRTFSNLFNGTWERYTLKENNKRITEPKGNFLEYLGDMTLSPHGNTTFSTADYTIYASMNIIDDNRLYLRLIGCDAIISNIEKQQSYRISPSPLDSGMIIPCKYRFYVGILELSFDMIYFERNKLFRPAADSKNNIIMKSIPYGSTQFPDDNKTAKYILYFTQQ